MATKKTRVSPMLQSIDLKNLPPIVSEAFFKYLNTVPTALELSECSKRYADFLLGVSTGEKLAQNILDFRETLKGGIFVSIEQVSSVAYFTEDKVRTLVGVFYVETGVWELPTQITRVDDPIPDQKSPEVIVEPELEDEGGGGQIFVNPGEQRPYALRITIYTEGGPVPSSIRPYVVAGKDRVSVDSFGKGKIPGTWICNCVASGDLVEKPARIRVDSFSANQLFLFGVEFPVPPIGGSITLRY